MISLIVAHDNSRVIGLNGDMPWGSSIKSDLKWFRSHTLNKTVLMGRLTFDSIGGGLPKRTNVILTKNESIKVYHRFHNYHVVHSVEDFINRWVHDNEEVFVIGGATLYEQFLPYVDRLYITHIDAEFEGDTYFPEYDLNNYNIIFEEFVFDQYPLKFAIYQKKQKYQNNT